MNSDGSSYVKEEKCRENLSYFHTSTHPTNQGLTVTVSIFKIFVGFITMPCVFACLIMLKYKMQLAH